MCLRDENNCKPKNKTEKVRENKRTTFSLSCTVNCCMRTVIMLSCSQRLGHGIFQLFEAFDGFSGNEHSIVSIRFVRGHLCSFSTALDISAPILELQYHTVQEFDLFVESVTCILHHFCNEGMIYILQNGSRE